MKAKLAHISMVSVLLFACMLMACATVDSSDTSANNTLVDGVQARIKPQVETLYLNVRELQEIYSGLRKLAQAYAIRGDNLQLDYVQKAAIYIQKSYHSASHQWEFLSIMEDIRSEAQIDYYTLRHKGLRYATNEAVYDERFIKIYRSQITNAEALKDIDRALEIIEANRDIFNQIMKAIAPLVRKSGPTEYL